MSISLKELLVVAAVMLIFGRKDEAKELARLFKQMRATYEKVTMKLAELLSEEDVKNPTENNHEK